MVGSYWLMGWLMIGFTTFILSLKPPTMPQVSMHCWEIFHPYLKEPLIRKQNRNHNRRDVYQNWKSPFCGFVWNRDVSSNIAPILKRPFAYRNTSVPEGRPQKQMLLVSSMMLNGINGNISLAPGSVQKQISRSCTVCQAWHNSELSTKERTYSGMVEMIGRLPRLGLTLVEYWNTLGLPNHVVL